MGPGLSVCRIERGNQVRIQRAALCHGLLPYCACLDLGALEIQVDWCLCGSLRRDALFRFFRQARSPLLR